MRKNIPYISIIALLLVGILVRVGHATPAGYMYYPGSGTDLIPTSTIATSVSTSSDYTWSGINSYSNKVFFTSLPVQSVTSTSFFIGVNSIVGGSASGTYFGINATSGFGGNILDIQIGSSSVLRMNSNGGLFVSSTMNVSGTISQAGVPVLTTSTGLLVGNFASANISQWTNNSNYLVNTRNVNTSGGLQGGGALTADLTLSINTSSAFSWSGSHSFTSTVLFTGTPAQGTTSSLHYIGPNTLNGANASGTWFGMNISTGTSMDFLHFQYNSSTVFKIATSTLTVGATTTINNGLSVGLTYANAARIESAAGNGYQGLRVNDASTADTSFSEFVTGDNFTRFSFIADGTLKWGNGNAVADTQLTRSATSTLNTPGTFTVAGNQVSTSTGANPSLSITLAATNGVANTYLRSDAAQALSQAITPTWTGTHIFNASTTFGAPINSTGTADTVTTGTCGASPTITGSNGINRVTTGTDASSTCTIVYAKPFAQTSICTFSTATTAQAISTSTIIVSTKTGYIISQASSTQFKSAVFTVLCMGW